MTLEAIISTETPQQQNLRFVRKLTLWRPGEPPQPSDTRNAGPVIRWFDLDPNAADVESVVRELGAVCPGLNSAMVEDLLQPDDEPEGKPFNGQIRLASSFSVTADGLDAKTRRGQGQDVGELIFYPVELLAGEDWLITCWHPGRRFAGAELPGSEPSSLTKELFDCVAARWPTTAGLNAGDLGVLIMHELSLSYASACRAIAQWLEGWELGLYLSDEPDREALAQIWASMAILRDWINPLNRPGLRDHLDKAWLPASNHAMVKATDDRIDRALDTLRAIAESLRGALQLLHVEQNEQRREHAEQLQRRIGVGAAAFLIPTLIVGFYGANTWVPGQQKHWGFWVMVAVLVTLTVIGVGLVAYLQRGETHAREQLADERRELRLKMRR